MAPRLYHATERGSCLIPQAEFTSLEGVLQLASFGQQTGLLDFRLVGTNVKVSVAGVVGHLPISPDATLVVAPKFPYANLSRMVWYSRQSLEREAPIDRFYELYRNTPYTLDVLLRSFAKSLQQMMVEGAHRAYNQVELVGQPRPKIDLGRSQKAFWSRGQPTRAHTSTFLLSLHNPANAILRSAAELSLAQSRRSSALSGESAVFRGALEILKRVPGVKFPPSDRDADRALRQVPTFRVAYWDLLPLAVEIIRGSSVYLDRAGGGIRGPSFLIDLELAFEAYIRNVLHERLWAADSTLAVLNGNNKRWQGRLFSDNNRYIIKPDLMFRRGSQFVLIGDAKYKLHSKEEDRYQVLTHTLARECSTAALIYPASDDMPSGLHRVGRVAKGEREITLYEYGFPLNDDPVSAETAMSESFKGLIDSLPTEV